jgi:hypothetical protein
MTADLTSTTQLITSLLLPLIKKSQDGDEPMLSAWLPPPETRTIAHRMRILTTFPEVEKRQSSKVYLSCNPALSLCAG